MLKGRPKPAGQCLGQQFVVAVEESDWALAIQQGSGALALVQQGDDTLSHGGWQAGGMLSLEGVLQDCQQLWAKHIPELREEPIWQAI